MSDYTSYRGLRRRLVPATGTVLACLLMAIFAAPALASWGFHKNIRPREGFFSPIGVATDEAGNIYVSSLFEENSKFNLAGELVPPTPFGSPGFHSGVAVNPADHNVYIVEAKSQEVEVYNSTTGQLEHSFPIPGTANIHGAYTFVQIAADVHGNVYVPDAPGNKVEVFNEAGNAPEGGVASEITGSGEDALNAPEGVAVSPAGDVWVADTGNGRIEEFEPSGAFVKEITSPHVQAVAVDESGNVFASIGGEGIESEVIEYSAAGTPIATFGAGVLKETLLGILHGIAVDSAHEIVYVANERSEAVQQFTSWTDATAPETGVAEGQATLHGAVEVEPGTSITSCTFEYGPTADYGTSVPCSPGGPYTADTAVSAAVSELTPGLDYHYRVSATSADGFTQVGEDHEFGSPVIDSESVEAVVATATPRAHITLFGEGASTGEGEATCKLQYVEEAQYLASGYTNAMTVPCTAPIGGLPGEHDVESYELTGLQADTVYHYRFLASNRAGTVIGPDKEFATFGIAPGSFAFDALNEQEEPFVQAGGHPYDLPDTFHLNATTHTLTNKATEVATDSNPKDFVTELPPGLIGNPEAVPKCSSYEVKRSACSGASQVGTIVIVGTRDRTEAPLLNVVPPKGVAAEFGAELANFAAVSIDERVRTGGDYGVTAEVFDSSNDEGVLAVEVTIWGVPAAESNDAHRFCPRGADTASEQNPCSEHGALTALLTNPTACTGEREARMTAEPWQQDEPPVVIGASVKMPAVTGCGKLKFQPSIDAQPSTGAADSPTGMHVDLHVPQPEGCIEEKGQAVCEDAESDLRDATVTFPVGMTVDPSSADGLGACSEEQAGFTGFKELDPGAEPGVRTAQFTGGPAECPDSAKLGTVVIHTPLVGHPIEGGLYLATPHANPFGSLVAVYLAAYDPISGVVVKLPGEVTLNQQTGQVGATFDQNPQLPFSDLEVNLFGGGQSVAQSRAALTTPETCGSYATSSVLEPWSHKGAAGEEGTPDATPSSTPFEVSGPSGGGCVHSEGEAPNAPVFEAGMASPVAGSFSPFVLKLEREDGSQHFGSLDVTLPDGLLGKVAGVEQCPQADIQAAQALSGEGQGATEQAHPSCPTGSEVGVVRVGVGSGAPYYVTGHVYFAGPYEGAPFSLAVITPAVAGPFDLGTVVVRAGLFVDPRTAQVTVKSDPFPTMLDGIPLDIRSIGVEVNRKEFTLNPTNCSVLSVTGSETSTSGQTVPLSDRFQTEGCTTLPFRPTLEASTGADTSHSEGASLTVHLGSGAGQANIAKVHIALPKTLPSRLETLRLACTEHVFAANPAACPAGSQVGSAVAHTPILQSPLTGPVYIVSHGAAAFPDVEMVLQGEGVTLILDGKTNIQHGITETTFESVPDAPVSSFEMSLPKGPHSILAAPAGKLCAQAKTRTVLVKKKVTVRVKRHGRTTKRKVTREIKQTVAASLVMPTTIQGQNGAVVHQSTPIQVTGCTTAVKHKGKPLKHEAKRKHPRHRQRKRHG